MNFIPASFAGTKESFRRIYGSVRCISSPIEEEGLLLSCLFRDELQGFVEEQLSVVRFTVRSDHEVLVISACTAHQHVYRCNTWCFIEVSFKLFSILTSLPCWHLYTQACSGSSRCRKVRSDNWLTRKIRQNRVSMADICLAGQDA